jgi:acetyl-CoA carboxylase biotin carboxyl carrier protein
MSELTDRPTTEPPLATDDELSRICAATARIHHLTGAAPTRVRVQHGGTVVEVEWAGEPAAARPPAASAVPEPAAPDVPAEPPGELVTSPLLGTFYRSPKPGAAPFVAPGDTVAEGQQVAIVEAMKLLNPVVATCAGTVRAVLVDDATPVEFGQALIVVDAAGDPG